MSLSWLAQQIVFASTELTASDKVLLTVLAQLDRGEQGAFIGEENLAKRVGLGADNVKRRRTGLVDAGLLLRLKQRGRRAAGWRVQWPATVVLPTSGRFDAAQFDQLVEAFDGAVRIAREDARTAPDATSERVHSNTPNAQRKGARESTPDDREREHSDTPFSGKGCTGSHPKGALEYTAELGERLTGKSVSSGKILNPPNSALADARARGERSDERHRNPSAEHVSAGVERALQRFALTRRQAG